MRRVSEEELKAMYMTASKMQLYGIDVPFALQDGDTSDFIMHLSNVVLTDESAEKVQKNLQTSKSAYEYAVHELIGAADDFRKAMEGLYSTIEHESQALENSLPSVHDMAGLYVAKILNDLKESENDKDEESDEFTNDVTVSEAESDFNEYMTDKESEWI